jgi:hypothetical protein
MNSKFGFWQGRTSAASEPPVSLNLGPSKAASYYKGDMGDTILLKDGSFQ